MAIVNFQDLPKLRKKFKDKKIVFCSGTFDLTHSGHVLFFEDCRKLGDLLFVAVGNDRSITAYKGKERPILNEHIRIKMVDSLKPVDYTFWDRGEFEEDDNLKLVRDAIEALKPDYYVFNTDVYNIEERKQLASRYPVKVVILNRWYPKEFDAISTTKIIEKIKNLSSGK